MEQEFFLHVGAPRTGTSFLRKHVFPKITGIHFKNKQAPCTTKQNELQEFFSHLAYIGEGDELSEEQHDLLLPKVNASKILVSEEHLIWSVYHLMGNIGSRALLLKKFVPKAKIILTIRKQSDFFNSIFKYFQTLESWHLNRQMNSITNMLNIEKKIQRVDSFYKFGLPVGYKSVWNYQTYSISDHYFHRQLRHFIAADISWYRLYQTYANLFGKDNVLVLPKELLSECPERLIELLSEFIDAPIKVSGDVFKKKINSSEEAKSNFTSKDDEAYFCSYILKINEKSNRKIDTELPYLNLKELGYFQQIEIKSAEKFFGFQTNEIKTSKYLPTLFQLIEDKKRVTLSHAVKSLVQKIIRKKPHKTLMQKTHYCFQKIYDQIRGVDFTERVSTQKLGIRKEIANQYESTKPLEIKKVLAKTKLPQQLVAIDFGSGKGQMLSILSSNTKVDKVFGIEISPELAKISEKNLTKLKITNATVQVCNATETPFAILDQCNLFYFYNPFPESVFRAVINRIEQSLRLQPRPSYLIYFHPIYADFLEEDSCFQKENTYQNLISNAVTSVFYAKEFSDKNVAIQTRYLADDCH